MAGSNKPEEKAHDDAFLPPPDLPPPLEDDDPELLQKDYYAEYQEEGRRAARMQRRLIITGVVLATIIVPLGYLRFTGKLTRNSVLQAINPAKRTRLGIARPASMVGKTSVKQADGKTIVKPIDDVGRDLEEYANESLPALAPMENKAVFDFASVTGANFRTNEEGVKVIREKVIPEFKAFMDEANKVSPKTEEVKAAHRIFLESERAKGKAYELIWKGVVEKNNALVHDSQQEFLEARRLSDLFLKRLKEIADKHGVYLQGIS